MYNGLLPMFSFEPTHLCRGYTPMDVCILEMQFWRQYKDAKSDGFKGHDPKYLAVLGKLKKTYIRLERLTCLPVPKNKWGCTCGACLGGYLSPRMQYRSVMHSHHLAIPCNALNTTKQFPQLAHCVSVTSLILLTGMHLHYIAC